MGVDTSTLQSLVDVVKEHSGMDKETIIQASVHGADSGFSGFTYYKDTVKFYEDNKELIWEVLNGKAEDHSESVFQFIRHFSSADSVVDDKTFKNLLAWFALEEAGHFLNWQ